MASGASDASPHSYGPVLPGSTLQETARAGEPQVDEAWGGTDELDMSPPDTFPEFVLRDKSRDCKQWFQDCLYVPNLPHEDWLEQRSAEFNWWTLGLNADKNGPGSLDARLRLRPDVTAVIVDALDGLEDALHTYHELATSDSPLSDEGDSPGLTEADDDSSASDGAHRAPSPWSDMSSGSRERPASAVGDGEEDNEETEDADNQRKYVQSPLSGDTYAEQRVYIENNLEVLIRIHTAIKLSGLKLRNKRADDALRQAEQEYERQKLTLGAHKALAGQDGEHERFRRYLTKLVLRNGYTEDLMRGLSFRVYQLAEAERCQDARVSRDLENSQDPERSQDARESAGGQTRESYAMLLQKKLLLVLRAYLYDPARLTTIQRRLVDANIVRRNRMVHAGSASKKRSHAPEGRSQPAPQTKPLTKSIAQRSSLLMAGNVTPSSSSLVPSPASRLVTESKQGAQAAKSFVAQPATALESRFSITRALTPALRSTARSAGTKMSARVGHLDYPSCSTKLEEDGSFRCDYCPMILPQEYKTKEKWRGHVAQDLCGYVCVFEDCESPGDMFASTYEWMSHMARFHSEVEWVCPVCAKQPLPDTANDVEAASFTDPSQLKNHILACHPSIEAATNQNELELVVSAGQRTAGIRKVRCPLCRPGLVTSEEDIDGCAVPQLPVGQSEGLVQLEEDQHVATHIHEFALHAFPSSDGEELPEEARESLPSQPSTRVDIKFEGPLIPDNLLQGQAFAYTQEDIRDVIDELNATCLQAHAMWPDWIHGSSEGRVSMAEVADSCNVISDYLISTLKPAQGGGDLDGLARGVYESLALASQLEACLPGSGEEVPQIMELLEDLDESLRQLPPLFEARLWPERQEPRKRGEEEEEEEEEQEEEEEEEASDPDTESADGRRAKAQERPRSRDDFSIDTRPLPRGLFIVPCNRNRGFVGREAVLDKLVREILRPYQSSEWDCQYIVIHGLGGIGKTEVALEAVYQVRDADPDCAVFWVRAFPINEFEDAYREIARQLGLQDLVEKGEDAKILVKEALSHRPGKWLLVLDCADSLHVPQVYNDLYDYLPSNPQGLILLTARYSRVGSQLQKATIITMGGMARVEAFELLHQNLGPLSDTYSSELLVDLMHGFPLAISEASRFMKSRQMSTAEYLQLCETSEENPFQVLYNGPEPTPNTSVYLEPLEFAWVASFEQIALDSPPATRYLHFICFLAQQEIPISLLPAQDDKSDAREPLSILEGYTYLELQDGLSLAVNPLVRLVVRNRVMKDGGLAKTATTLIQDLAKTFQVSKYASEGNLEIVLLHIVAALGWRQYCRVAEAPLDLMLSAAEGYSFLQKWDKARKLSELAVQLSSEAFGPRDPHTWSSMDRLVGILQCQGRNEEAAEVSEQLLETKQEILGLSHPDTLSTMNSYGETNYKLGRFDQAVAMFQTVLEQRSRVLGEQDPDTLSTTHCLAETLYKRWHEQGSRDDRDEAKILFKIALNGRSNALGEEHPDTISTMELLARTLHKEEAVELFQKALRARRALLGNEHPDTLSTMDGLADASTDLWEASADTWVLDQAEGLAREVLQRRTEQLGAEHPDTLRSVHRLDRILLLQDRNFEEANSLTRDTIEKRETVLGTLHPETITSQLLLAENQHLETPEHLVEGEDWKYEMWTEAAVRFRTTCGQSITRVGTRFEDIEVMIGTKYGASSVPDTVSKAWVTAKSAALRSLEYLKVLVDTASSISHTPAGVSNMTANALGLVFDTPEPSKQSGEVIGEVFGIISSALSQFRIYESMQSVDSLLIRQIHQVLIKFINLCAHVIRHSQVNRLRRHARITLDEDKDLKMALADFCGTIRQQRDIEGTTTLRMVMETRQDMAELLENSGGKYGMDDNHEDSDDDKDGGKRLQSALFLMTYFLPHDDLFALLFEQNLVESMNSPFQGRAANTAGGSYHLSGTQGHQSAFMPNIPDDEGQEWGANCPANEGVLLSSETPGEGWDLV